MSEGALLPEWSSGPPTGGPVTDRRAVGVLLIVLGLLAAVIVPNVIGRGIPGSAQPVAVPAAPSIGDCVGQPFDVQWNWVTDSAAYHYPDLSLGGCELAHYGEVVSVITHPTPVKMTDSSEGGLTVDDQNYQSCNDGAGPFIGLPDAAGRPPSTLFGYWWLTIFVGFAPLAPTAQQRAAGAQWLACTVYLTDRDTDGESLVRYRGTLHDAVSTGVGRDYLGYCPAEADWTQATSASCTNAHHGEVFGYAMVTEDVARATLVSSCAKLAEQVTKNPDLFGDGRLVVSVQAIDNNGQTIKGATIPQDSTPQCGVLAAGGRELTGSLIAIGSDPIPWA
ncbi:hypothetical protein [Nakamurella lactea]|uniref:hypothetical protein n=1 Tax=Nakamurella lactea TaxID=459515 RepID=UPI0012B5E9F1|nr:hypothetical protein [Nakamurella lactea]